MFRLVCPNCHHPNDIPPKYAGKRIKCPGCGGPLVVPVSGGGAPPAGRGESGTGSRIPPRRSTSRADHAARARQAGAPPGFGPPPPPMGGRGTGASARATRRHRRQQPTSGSRKVIVICVVAVLLLGGIVALIVVAVNQSEKRDDFMTYVENREKKKLEKERRRHKKIRDHYIEHTKAHDIRPGSGGPDTVTVAGTDFSVSGKREKVPSLSHSTTYDEDKDETLVLTAETPVEIKLGDREIIVQVGYIHPGKELKSRSDVTGVIYISGDTQDLEEQSLTVNFDGQNMLLRNGGARAGKVVFDLTKQQIRELAQSAEIRADFGRVSFAFVNEHMRLLEQIRIIE